MAVCPECLAQLDSMHVSGCWQCNAGFGDGSGWKPISSELAPSSPAISPLRPPRPQTAFGQLATYGLGGFALLIVCFIGALATAFAGSMHGQPVWLIPFLAVTQALPLFLFFVSSWSMLNSIANRTRFTRIASVWYGSLAVYFASWGLLIIYFSLGSNLR